jgi:hypothetical protein
MKNEYVHFIPVNDAELGRWAKNYDEKIPILGPLLGLTPAEITDQKDAANVVIEAADKVTLKKKEQKEAIDLMKNVRNNELQVIVKTAIGLKLKPVFKSNVGQELGIMGTTISPQRSILKPSIKLTTYGGIVEIAFNKRRQNGVKIFSMLKGGSEWKEVAIATHSPYADNSPLQVPGTAETRIYMAKCWDHIEFGQESDAVFVTVGA